MSTSLQQLASDLSDLADTLQEIREALKQHQQAGRFMVRIDLPTDIDSDGDLLKQLLYALESA